MCGPTHFLVCCGCLEMEKKVKVKPRRAVKVIMFLIIFIVLFGLWARYINTVGLVVQEIAIIDEDLNDSYNGFKIVQFSDIHYGRTTSEDDLSNVIESINELNPDIIVFTGDLFDEADITDSDVELMVKYLEKLEARLFKLAIIGDYDEKYLDSYKLILEESDFILLDNSAKLVYDNSSEPLNFVGLTDTTDIAELYENDYFTITLVHEPDSIKDISGSNIVLAGHSLGGQLKIPFLGGIIKQDGASTYINDYYLVNDQKLYISNGIGTQNFSFRTFNKPSITLYRLYNY